ncbi:MAG: SpoIID/LytB domain-containing protein [Candidatus Eisenbacteria sp.]|nr:SpoIID/LytB domain-containing protein [Candidatus Eisenbacteria bacterium]
MHRYWKIAVLIAFIAGCAPAQKWRKAPSGIPAVRVLLVENASSVTVSADGPFRLSFPGRNGPADVFPSGAAVRIEWAGSGRVRVFRPAEEASSEHPLPLYVGGTDRQTAVSVNGKPYRGKINLARGGSGILVVNALDIESYLRGVVPCEIGYLQEEKIEAVKAQAIAARTYARKRLGNGKSEDYDLVATVADQVYKGKSAEHRLSDRAILETEGIVAVHRRKLIDAYYSSTCGGRTAAIRDVWEKGDAPYLRGVRDCAQGKSENNEAYCRNSPYFKWTVTWEGAELAKILSRSLPVALGKKIEMGEIKDIRVRGTHRCGRVKTLEIRTTRGKHRIHGDKVRWVLRQPGNGKALWSARFKIKVKRSGGRVSRVVATGRGFGHGVGLCQEGAIQMSRDGKRYDQILKHYYPGIHLERIPYKPVS